MIKIGNCSNLVCINYPGRVENVEKMYETLGGIKEISEIICDGSKKLPLRFRPEDRLCKPVLGSRKPSSSLLLKIKVKKKTKKIVSYSVVGIVKEEFHFSAMCDFQFIAMDKDVNIYDQVVASSLNVDWLKGDGPLIITPVFFSRSDTLQSYYFATEGKHSTCDGESLKVIASSRRRRQGLAEFLSFEDEQLPNPPVRKTTDNKFVTPEVIQHLKELFEKRPIYSKSAMSAESGISESMLKDVAPFVAYHFNNGPWRALWVRFGYDPRKDPQARIYQVLDYRLKGDDEEELVETKRKMRRPMRQITKKGPPAVDDKHILKPGRLPPSRQFFYQYCDVHLPEFEAILASAEVRTECHPVDGWFPEGTSFACRRIIKQYVSEATKQHQDDGAGRDDFSASEDERNSDSEEDAANKSFEVE